MTTPLPPSLRGKVFTVAEAQTAGLSRRVLQGSRFDMVAPGLYRYADSPLTFEMKVRGALKMLPKGVALSHITNLRWRGLDIGRHGLLHFASNANLHVIRPGMQVHRFKGRIHATTFKGVPILGPDRTFVDSATMLGLSDLVRAGDWLIANGHTDLNQLDTYVTCSHLDGVKRARRAMPLLRSGVESIRETDVRLILVQSGLPEPEINTDIHDSDRRFLARGDLVYRRFKVLVEYDGWQHERDAGQRQRDHLRRERLEAEGWRVIVITAIDLRSPRTVANRVRAALVSRGYAPRFGG